MEVYRSTSQTVNLELPGAIRTAMVVDSTNPFDVFAVADGVAVHEFSTVTATTTGFSVTIPWTLMRQDRDFNIEWTFSYMEGGTLHRVKEVSFIQVVTGLLTEAEVAAISGFDLTTRQQDILDLERQVRYAIQTYTGQNFGRFRGAMAVSGNGSKSLALPAPLLEFTGLAFDGGVRSLHGLSIINNGWAITGGRAYIDSIKQAPPEWLLDRFDYNGKISHPYADTQNYFYDGVEYIVEGAWGYNDVPSDVKQAARLLISDYSCDEALWRDRYIDSIRAGDWRFEFNAQAFAGTGNVQADQILSGYRRATMVVV